MVRSGSAGQPRALSVGGLVVAALIVFTDLPAAAGDNAIFSGLEPNWTGAYVGGHVGAAWGRSDWSAGGRHSLRTVHSASATPSISHRHGQLLRRLANRLQLRTPLRRRDRRASRRLVSNTLLGTQTIAAAGFDVADYEEKVLFSGTLRGRLGYAFGPWLVYGTGGYAWGDEQLTRTQVSGATAGTEETRRSFRSAGWRAQASKQMSANNWTANLEYLFTDFGSHGVTFPAGGQTFSSELTLQSVRLGLNYQLGEPDSGKRSVLPASHIDDWAVHAQTTYSSRTIRIFIPLTSARTASSPVSRARPGTPPSTWACASGRGRAVDRSRDRPGLRPERHPRRRRLPSGEAYKVGNSYPYARIPRFFVRDTISLGGANDEVEAGANQFAGSQTANRIVLTLGKFAVTDVFDTNKYAHDPRADWMNGRSSIPARSTMPRMPGAIPTGRRPSGTRAPGRVPRQDLRRRRGCHRGSLRAMIPTAR